MTEFQLNDFNVRKLRAGWWEKARIVKQRGRSKMTYSAAQQVGTEAAGGMCLLVLKIFSIV